MNNNESKNPTVLKFEFPQVVNEAILPLAKSIGITLSHGWEGLTMGIDTWYGKKKIERDHNLQLYKDEIQKELSSIPEENLQEPKMNILGPSLEASKFYFEEPQYREMFSKLIASSFDSQKNNVIHPFFTEAIKQMTPLDAHLLSLFKDKIDLPIASYKFKTETGFTLHYPYVFFEERKETTPEYFSASIINLQRLGFISVNFGEWFIDESKYEIYKNNIFFQSMVQQVSSLRQTDPNSKIQEYTFDKGMMRLTPLGKNFLDICI